LSLAPPKIAFLDRAFWSLGMLWGLQVYVTPSIYLVLTLALVVSNFVLYLLAAGDIGFVHIMWPNHFNLCLLIYLTIGVVPTVLVNP
jgi:hypothetical protein